MLGKCSDCPRPAKHLRPFLLCDSCWADRFSVQRYEGKDIPFKRLFEMNLRKRGLFYDPDKDGTVSDWYERVGKTASPQLSKYVNSVSESEG